MENMDRFVTATDGVQIHFQCIGSGLPALLFVHGTACNASFWSSQLQAFARDHQVIAVDLGGHGQSSLGRKEWSIESFAGDVNSVADAMQLDSFVLVGHSMGGPVVVEAAIRMPGRVIGVIAVEAFHDVDNPRSVEEIETFLGPMRGDFRLAMESAVRHYLFIPQSRSDLVAQVARDMASAHPDVAVSVIEHSERYPAASALEQLRIPMHLINADYVHTSIDAARRHKPDVGLTIMSHTGHFPMLEAPEEFNQALAKACDGMLERTENGEAIYKACFASGTLVHTDHGLIPIERIRVGTRVLSQPENGGERDYRRVSDTVAHLDQEVFAVQVRVDGAEALTTLIATLNHTFWVENISVKGAHWLAAECLEPGHVLQLADGRKAWVHAAGKIRRTQHAHLGFAADERAGVGIVLDLSEKQIRPAGDDVALSLGQIELGEPFLTPVYNFTVEGFHTYYVGETGVWVRNNNCTVGEALEFVTTKIDRDAPRPTCFPMDTLVATKACQWCEIDLLDVGSWVLSRCETTGEQAYRRVTKKYEHQTEGLHGPKFPLYRVSFVTESGKQSSIDATAEHPFWANGIGWVKACDLQPGQMLEICDPFAIDDVDRPEGQKSCDLYLSGQRWQAEVVSVLQKRSANTVYNIEVEDFHTYFVGGYGIWVHNKTQPAR